MDKAKLLVTGSTFPRWKDDTEPRFILDYARAMSRYYDVTVMVPAAVGAKDFEVMEGVQVRRFHYFPVHKCEVLCYPGAITARIKQNKCCIFLVPFLLIAMIYNLKQVSKKFDCVHAHWLIPQGIGQSFVKKIPYIVTGHGGDITSINNVLMKRLKVRALKKARYITVVSDVLNGFVQNLYPNKKTSVISMGCDLSRFTPEKRIENYFHQNGKKVILFVGRLVEIKGTAYLIQAMKYIENAVLIIVGKGDLEEELRVQAKELGDKVMFWGAKTHQELPAVYASADVFVVPSVTTDEGAKEGFGLVILEAMASGLPVVASNSGGIPGIIQDRYNGLLCEEKCVWQLAESIDNVLNDVQLSQELIQRGIETSREYSYERIAEKYNAILQNI